MVGRLGPLAKPGGACTILTLLVRMAQPPVGHYHFLVCSPAFLFVLLMHLHLILFYSILPRSILLGNPLVDIRFPSTRFSFFLYYSMSRS